MLGRKVDSIMEKEIGPGSISLSWDGKNILGQRLGNGIYFARPMGNLDLKTVKLILIK